VIRGLDTGFLVAIEVIEHPKHQDARHRIADFIAAGDTFALSPQVLAEFIHIETDSKRFAAPLTIDAARDRAQKRWTAAEIVHVFCTDSAMTQFFDWHRQYRLGRKRILDTLLAATYHRSNIKCILTLNPQDFEFIDDLELVTP
jgi:predicted nucleic acid-binding protein